MVKTPPALGEIPKAPQHTLHAPVPEPRTMLMTTFKAQLLAALLFSAAVGQAQVVINEVCASNLGTQADNFGDFSDWVELYNTTGAGFDISGWWLSDNPGNPQKWEFPAGTIVPANGRLIIWCTGRNLGAPAMHTSFKLNQTAQETIVLSDPGGTTMDDFQLAQPTQEDHSWGRTTDGANTWNIFTNPTPGLANTGASSYYATKPVLTPGAGFYAGAQNVSIAPVPGCDVRYTTNGDLPTAASTLYAGPIPVNSTTVIRAAAFPTAPGVPVSYVETNTYFINANHTVAVLSIAGNDLNALLENGNQIEPLGSFEYFGPDGTLRDEAIGEFNEHGQDSWAYDQRGFDYIVRDETGYNDALHYPIFRTKQRDEFQRVIVKALAGDNVAYGPGQPAHVRDPYVQALSQLGDLAVDERSYEPAVLYLNGEYWGVYDLREKVDDHDFTDHYYDQDENNIQFLKTWGGTWSEYGGAQAQADWDALRNYIASNNMGNAANFAYVDSLYNWHSLIDYFCLNSYTVCADWLNWNTAWWRGLDPNGDKKKWRYVLWDMDATFGHYGNFTGIPDQSPDADPCTVEQLPNPGGQGHTEILSKLLAENQDVYNYYVNRYIDLGNTVFNCDNMLALLDSFVAVIDPEMQAQCNRWPNASYATWQANVQVMRDFIITRCVTIETGLVDCYDVTGPFDVMFDVDPPLSGSIQVNSQVLPSYPFTGTYYGGITTSMAPIPATGWVFSHWTIANDTISPSTLDSLVTLDFDVPDTVIAHFIPPIRYDVLVDVDPRTGGYVQLGNTTITQFPHIENVPHGVPLQLKIFPAEFHDWEYWEILHNDITPDDSLEQDVSITFFSTDTIIAHLDPQQHGYYLPNAFTPNGDGINDVWFPGQQVVEAESYSLTVFNRWGEVIYNSTDPTDGWDGSASGADAPNGVYVFKAHVVDAISKEDYDFNGHVTLFR